MAAPSHTTHDLRADHTNFAELLNVLEAQFNIAVDATGKADLGVMRDVMDYMTHYPDQFHHPKEDLVFKQLVLRQPMTEPLVQKLLTDHQLLAREGMALLKILRDVADGELASRDTLRSVGCAYVEHLRSHMEVEEDEIFGLADEHLSEEDWIEINEQIAHTVDPLFGEITEEKYRALCEFIRRESDSDDGGTGDPMAGQ